MVEERISYIRETIQLIPDAITIIDREGTIIEHNTEATQLFGYAKKTGGSDG